MSRVYLDWNATAPLRPEARAAMLEAMDLMGNPSSVHAEGRAAKGMIEKARVQVARLVGCDPTEVIFTSGATEAAAMCKPEYGSVAASEIEHDAILAWCQLEGVPMDRHLDVDRNGRLVGTARGRSFEDEIWDEPVALQIANSETGVVQDVAPLIEHIRGLKRETPVFCDAVQALGKTAFSFGETGADHALVSGHKFGSAKGIGALVSRSGQEPRVVIKGGGQEQGWRSGTENIIGIAGFGAAAQAACRDLENGVWEPVEALRNNLEDALYNAAPETIFFGRDVPRLPNTSCFAMPGWKGETQVMQMDLAGYAISAGSACSSGKVKESRVLRAMGFDSVKASSAVRVSIGPATTEDDLMGFARTWIEHYRRWRQRAA